MSLLSHAEHELRIAGFTGPGADDYAEAIAKAAIEIVRVFSDQGHSGVSAPIVIDLLKKLLNYDPLTPLTGEDSEWNDVSESSGKILFQNVRCSRVFKDENGRAYDIRAYVFEDDAGCSYTSSRSVKTITFPYTPNTIYVPYSELNSISGDA